MHTHPTTSIIFVLLKKAVKSVFRKHSLIYSVCITAFLVIAQASSGFAQAILFDFDNAPLHSSLPIYQTAGGITAHLTATGQGYSVQTADVLGFTPPGFAGRVIYPNSVYLSDLLISFDHTLSAFSIMYSVQELGCDNSATMRVTAYKNGSLIGTNTRTATFPGTWPVDTLSCTFPQGFDSVVVHYASPPPTCQDYGVIYMADNMRVTQLSVPVLTEGELLEMFTLKQNYPNPFNPSTTISYNLRTQSFVTLKVYDLLGREVTTLVNNVEEPGFKSVNFNATNLTSGVYYYCLQAGNYSEIKKLVLLK